MRPGGEFSFNKVGWDGARRKRDIRKRLPTVEARSLQEPGGGVCQVSSTMYRVAFQSGMQITFEDPIPLSRTM